MAEKKILLAKVRFKNGRTDEDIYKVANSRLGLYAKASGDVINFILNPTILFEYYLAK